MKTLPIIPMNTQRIREFHYVDAETRRQELKSISMALTVKHDLFRLQPWENNPERIGRAIEMFCDFATIAQIPIPIIESTVREFFRVDRFSLPEEFRFI